MKARSVLLSLSLLTLLETAVWADGLNLEGVYHLLMKVAAAPAHVEYHGIVQTISAGPDATRTVVVQIEHSSSGSDRVTIIRPSEDAGRVFARNTGEDRRHEGDRALSLGFLGEKGRVESDLALLLSNYRLSAVDGEPIAGRTTYRIDIVPEYPDRKSKSIWVDRRTGIVLKSIVNRPVGDVAVTTEFTQIQLSPESWTLPSSDNQPLVLPKQGAEGVSTGTEWIGITDKTELATLNALAKKENFALLSPRYLPQGFVMEEVREFPSPTNAHAQVVHILYSDGLSSISLFLQQEEPFWPDRIRSFFFGRRHDANHHRPEEHGVAVVEGAESGTRYVLVSDVATETLKRMADSLSPTQGVGTK